MRDGGDDPIEHVQVRLGEEGARLPHARLRHLARSAFSGRARWAPDVDPRRLNLLLEDELAHLPGALRRGITEMAGELRSARREGADMPSITFRLLARGGMVEELDA